MIEFSRKRVHEGVSAADGRVYTDRCRGKIRSTGVPPVSRDIRSMSRECTSGEKKNSQLNTTKKEAPGGAQVINVYTFTTMFIENYTLKQTSRIQNIQDIRGYSVRKLTE